jgi:nucleotide-binding universal stress UspA family protein
MPVAERHTDVSIRRILCPLDAGSAGPALHYASTLARWYDAHLETPAHERRGNAGRRILEQANREGCDLIVLGTREGGGLDRLAADIHTVLREAGCPVLAVPGEATAPTGRPSLRRILCAFDFSPAASSAASYATSLMHHADAQMVLLHVMAANGDTSATGIRQAESQMAAWLAERVPIEPGRTATALVISGRPWEGILSVAAGMKADLIVIGAHDRSVDHLAFGSNTLQVLRYATCPVLVARNATV